MEQIINDLYGQTPLLLPGGGFSNEWLTGNLSDCQTHSALAYGVSLLLAQRASNRLWISSSNAFIAFNSFKAFGKAKHLIQSGKETAFHYSITVTELLIYGLATTNLRLLHYFFSVFNYRITPPEIPLPSISARYYSADLHKTGSSHPFPLNSSV